jgi:hypothetical protein
VQTHAEPLMMGDIHLQELGAGIPLHLNQIGHIHNLRNFSKTLTETFARGERRSHKIQKLSKSKQRGKGTGQNHFQEKKCIKPKGHACQNDNDRSVMTQPCPSGNRF